MPNTKSPDFKTYYANGFGFSFGENDCRMLFGISDVEGDPNSLIEQTVVYMSHRTLKTIAHSATELVKLFEARTGVEIPIDPDKMEAFKKMLEDKMPVSDSPTELPPLS